jgi:hypothetical protein
VTEEPTPEDRWRADVASRWEKILRANAEGMGSAVYEDQEACRLALAEIKRLRRCMNPRQWTPHMDQAWHRAIPDVAAAFAAVEEASRAD